MAAIYSVCFVRAHPVDTDTAITFVFPPGFVYVVRQMDVFLAGVGGGEFGVADDAGCTFWSVTSAEAGTGFWEQWKGRQIFQAGWSMTFSCHTIDPFGHGDWRVSGYQFPVP